jgi:hypothetical protein
MDDAPVTQGQDSNSDSGDVHAAGSDHEDRLTLEEVFELYSVIKPYIDTLKGNSDVTALTELLSAISDRDPKDFIRLLSVLTHKDVAALQAEVTDGTDALDLFLSSARTQNLNELLSYGIVAGVFE